MARLRHPGNIPTAIFLLAREDPAEARREIRLALMATAGVIPRAAHLLDVSNTQMNRMIEVLGLREDAAVIRRAFKSRFRLTGGAA